MAQPQADPRFRGNWNPNVQNPSANPSSSAVNPTNPNWANQPPAQAHNPALAGALGAALRNEMINAVGSIPGGTGSGGSNPSAGSQPNPYGNPSAQIPSTQPNSYGAPQPVNTGGAPLGAYVPPGTQTSYNQGPPASYNQGGAPLGYNQGPPNPSYNQGGIPPQGYNQGMPPQGYNQIPGAGGYDQGGIPPQGYNQGMPPQGYQAMPGAGGPGGGYTITTSQTTVYGAPQQQQQIPVGGGYPQPGSGGYSQSVSGGYGQSGLQAPIGYGAQQPIPPGSGGFVQPGLQAPMGYGAQPVVCPMGYGPQPVSYGLNTGGPPVYVTTQTVSYGVKSRGIKKGRGCSSSSSSSSSS